MDTVHKVIGDWLMRVYVTDRDLIERSKNAGPDTGFVYPTACIPQTKESMQRMLDEFESSFQRTNATVSEIVELQKKADLGEIKVRWMTKRRLRGLVADIEQIVESESETLSVAKQVIPEIADDFERSTYAMSAMMTIVKVNRKIEPMLQVIRSYYDDTRGDMRALSAYEHDLSAQAASLKCLKVPS